MNLLKTALRRCLPVLALWLAAVCPLPVCAAGVGAVLPVSVAATGSDTAYTVNLTPLDSAPAPTDTSLTVKRGGTAYFTGFVFDAPGDYRYCVAQARGTAADTVYDTHSYTVTFRVTSRPGGGLQTTCWAVRSGDTAKADGIRFTNGTAPPAAAVQTAAATPVKTVAAPTARTAALPQTADGFPLEALLTVFCAGVVGFGTAWTKRR